MSLYESGSRLGASMSNPDPEPPTTFQPPAPSTMDRKDTQDTPPVPEPLSDRQLARLRARLVRKYH
jgi:hypothetical protein